MEEQATYIEKGNKKIVSIFLYMLVISFFVIWLYFYTFSLEGEIFSIFYNDYILFLSLLILITVFLTFAVFGIFRSYVFASIVIILTIILALEAGEGGAGPYFTAIGMIPITLILGPLIYFISKVYYRVKLSNKKILAFLLLSLPFLLLIFITIVSAVTCSFYNNYICLSNRAIENGDTEICSMGSNVNVRYFCYNRLAISVNDTNLCPNNKEQCVVDVLINLARTGRASSEVCEEYSDTTRNLCYSNFALEEDNILLCEKTDKSFAYSDDCYIMFAVQNKDFSICNRVEGESRDYCYSGVAKVKKDLELCKNINDSSIKNYCFKEINN